MGLKRWLLGDTDVRAVRSGCPDRRGQFAAVMCRWCAGRWLVGRSIVHRGCAEDLAQAIDQFLHRPR